MSPVEPTREPTRDTVGFLRLPLAAKRRRARPLLVALRRVSRVALVAVPIAGLVAWTLTSPVFALDQITVEGLDRVEAGWVESALAPWHGSNLVSLDLVMVQGRLAGHRWIRSADVRKLLPDTLAVRVIEHRPQAVLRIEDAAFFLDQQGEVITELGGESEAGLLVVRERATGRPGAIAVRRRALELAGKLAAEPALAGLSVREIGSLGGGFRVELVGLGFSLYVLPETALENVRMLDLLLPQLRERLGSIAAVDLRYSRRIVVKTVAAVSGAPELG